jgi:hypothetical protein
MAQTDDIWSRPIVTSGEAAMRISASIGRCGEALERIADALEARNVIDGQMAEFAELLQQGAPQVAHEGHPDLAPDGMPRKRR